MITDLILKTWRTIHSALFPKHCVGCQQTDTYLCPNCHAQIPTVGQFGEQVIWSAVPYQHPAVRQLVWLLKYRGIKEIAKIFSLWLYEALLEELAEQIAYHEKNGKILVIPIPLSAKRKRQRGFNQAEEIARELVALDPALFRLEANNLVKIKNTATQVSVNDRQKRLANLSGAFSLKNRRALAGRTIILLDDVATTGATLTEAEKILGRGRPRRIIKVVVAR